MEFIFYSFTPSSILLPSFVWLCSHSAPLIPSQSPSAYCPVSHILQRFFLACGRKQTLCLFPLLWRFDFVISLMQSGPATCPGHRKPPPITTELLSWRTKTQSLCFQRDGDEEVEGMRDGMQKLNPVQVCAAFMFNEMGLSTTYTHYEQDKFPRVSFQSSFTFCCCHVKTPLMF